MKKVTKKDAGLKQILKVDEKAVQSHLDEVVRQSVEDTLNGMLDAEADHLCQAKRYERTPDRADTRAGSYERSLHTKAGEVTLRMPKLRSLPFETQIIERYRRRESSVEEALIESAERLGLPEFNFFCITLAIHRETGGNLTETLVNLADVLRRRAQMVLKIRALSAESRSSAMILGALPFVVFAIIWAADATYLAGFFTDRRLMITGISGLVWMSIGALVMARMVSFKI